MKRSIVAVTGLAVAFASPSLAKGVDDVPPPRAIQQLLDCARESDSAARLACFDRESRAVSGDLASKNLVIVDRERQRGANRSLFGLSVQAFTGLFGSDVDVKQIEAKLVSVSVGPLGAWTVRLDDGSTWSQIDDATNGRPPKPGVLVQVKRASLGAYIVNIGSAARFKAKRVG